MTPEQLARLIAVVSLAFGGCDLCGDQPGGCPNCDGNPDWP